MPPKKEKKNKADGGDKDGKMKDESRDIDGDTLLKNE